MVSTQTRAPSRFRLYLPFGLLALVAIAWSAGWLLVRERVFAETAAWRERELAEGRLWTCPNERVGGFPFRIELRCDNPTLTWGPEAARISASLSGLTMITQVYQLRRAIIEASGPLTVRLPEGDTLDGNWESLRASLHGSPGRLERLSLVSAKPAWTTVSRDGFRDTVSADAIDFQGRPDPERYGQDETVDLALTITKASLPLANALVGDEAVTDVSLIAKVSQTGALAGYNPIDAAESWRMRGGAIEVLPLLLSKGERKLEARGTLGLDSERKPAGQIELAAAGLDNLIGRLVGRDQRTTSMIMSGLSLLGRRPAPAAAGLKPLPTLNFQNGRLLIGPFPVAEIAPLY